MSGISNEAQRRLAKLALAFSGPARRATFFGPIYLVLLALIGAALVARFGESASRIIAVVLLLSPLIVLIPGFRRRRRERQRPALAAERAVRAVDPGQAGKLVQALGLVEGLRQDGGESEELAALHLSRVLDGVSLTDVSDRGRARGRWLSAATFALLATALASVLLGGFAIGEGLNVLVARGGIAPFPAPYLEDMEILVESPPQIKRGIRRLPLLSSRALLPVGSQLRVRVLPRVSGRRFVLTDGVREEPFVSDGRGSLVSRLEILDPADVRVAAVFGDVRIFAEESIRVSTIDDYPPEVRIDGGARQIPLAKLDRLELGYAARDDYGLSLLELVIRTGRREERIELARPGDGERIHLGAHVLGVDHPLLKGAFLPVLVWVEARDNNGVTEPGVGKSEVVTLLPRPLGEALGARHRELREFRGRLVDGLASVLTPADGVVEDPSAGARLASELLREFTELEERLSSSPDPPRGSLQFLRAQLESMDAGDPSAVESVVLATDVLQSELSRYDAKAVAEGLAAAVDELAARAHQADAPKEELETLLLASRQGAEQLRDIGDLGLDLGSVALGDLGRMARLVDTDQRERARAAALHLAARLRRGTPSFGAKSAGVESGMPAHGGEGTGAPSTAPSDYDELVEQADALAQEHATRVSELERMLEEASRAAAEDAARRPENRRLAEQLREALQDLPSLARFPGTAESEAAAARGFGEAMADSLEAGRLPDAIDRGTAALEALGRASELRDAIGGYISQRDLERARTLLQEARKAAEAQRSAQSADSATRSQLRERAQGERDLARRARELAEQGGKGEARLPERALRGLEQAGRTMEDAARAMDRGDAEAAKRLSLDAQRQLESAQPERRQTQRSPSQSADGSEEGSEGSGDVPGESGDPARDFRRRVEEGLGRYSGRFSPAVRRYAEDLK